MTSGTVKWFNDEKGFGFIVPDQGDEELFVHHSEILGEDNSSFLQSGETVQFETTKDLKGPNAVKVKRSLELVSIDEN